MLKNSEYFIGQRLFFFTYQILHAIGFICIIFAKDFGKIRISEFQIFSRDYEFQVRPNLRIIKVFGLGFHEVETAATRDHATGVTSGHTMRMFGRRGAREKDSVASKKK